MIEEVDGLVGAFVFDGRGGAREIDWEEVEAWTPEQGFLWLHLDYTEERVQKWLEEKSGIEHVVRASLAAEETRPRSLVSRDGLHVILRTVNLNPGADPEDMVSLRIWVDASKAVTLRQRRVMAIADLRDSLREGEGPNDAGSFLVETCNLIAARVAGVLTDLDDAVDELEDRVLTAESHDLRSQIGALRRQSIALRRHLAPQRDALGRLQYEKVSWLDEMDRQHLREDADRITRLVEDLDSARDRAAVVQEELNTRLSDQMNRNMYLLSIVAAIFLPLGLLTGLLGINVGGIPGTESPWAFTIVCAILLVLAIALAVLFHLKRMI